MTVGVALSGGREVYGDMLAEVVKRASILRAVVQRCATVGPGPPCLACSIEREPALVGVNTTGRLEGWAGENMDMKRRGRAGFDFALPQDTIRDLRAIDAETVPCSLDGGRDGERAAPSGQSKQ
jgi:hypothetical protein